MLRSISVAVGDILNTLGSSAEPPRPLPPTFTVRHAVHPYVHDGVGRVYQYTIPSACGSAFFYNTMINDLRGYDATASSLRYALDQYIQEHGEIREGYVVLRSWDWTGHFIVSENKNSELLILRLAEPVLR